MKIESPNSAGTLLAFFKANPSEWYNSKQVAEHLGGEKLKNITPLGVLFNAGKLDKKKNPDGAGVLFKLMEPSAPTKKAVSIKKPKAKPKAKPIEATLVHAEQGQSSYPAYKPSHDLEMAMNSLGKIAADGEKYRHVLRQLKQIIDNALIED